jgi:HSP20 family molecular chaperone IbpA
MAIDREALRRVLRSSPGVLARSLGAAEPVLQPAEVGVEAPTFELFDEGDELLVIGELPGVTAAQIRVYAYPVAVVVHVRGGRGASRQPMPLPRRIDPASLSCTFRNGILVARASCADAP